MQKKTILLPVIKNQELLAKYYSLADVFVICSKRENLPTTCLEAQCCGTPVIGFDVGGTKETSVYSECDFVPYGDIQGLKECFFRVLDKDKEETSRRAVEAFSKEKMMENYLEEYDRGGKKQRVLLLDVNCKYSSTGKIVYDLFQNLKSIGRDVAICYGRGELIKEKGIYKFGLDWETRIHALLARVVGLNGYFSPLSTKRLLRYIGKFKPDVIHIHELHAYFVNIKPLMEYIKKNKIKVVWTFHCEYMYTGKCGHAYECNGFQQECGKCPEKKAYPKSLFFDQTKKMLRMKKKALEDLDFTIITPSQWLAERVKMSFLKHKNLSVIYNGIDTEIFHPTLANELKEELGIPNENRIVLAVAPNIMSEAKGGDWVIRLAEEFNDEDVTFILIGDVKKK